MIRNEKFSFSFVKKYWQVHDTQKKYLKGQEPPQVVQSWPKCPKSKDRVKTC